MKTNWTVDLMSRALENAREFRAEIVDTVYRAESFSDALSWKLARIIELEMEISYLERVIGYSEDVDIDEARCKAASDLVQTLIDDDPKIEMVHGVIEHLRRRAVRHVLRRYSPHHIEMEV